MTPQPLGMQLSLEGHHNSASSRAGVFAAQFWCNGMEKKRWEHHVPKEQLYSLLPSSVKGTPEL